MYYESGNFSVSSLYQLLNSENFRFPFFYEKKPNLWVQMWKIKRQKIVRKLRFENCTWQIFGRPQVTENPASLRLKCKFTTLLCAPPQIFVVAERTRSYLAISPTYSGVITSNTQNKPKVTSLRAESLAVPCHKLWLSFTSQITFGRSGQSRANLSIQSLIWSDGSLLRRFKPWASQK